MVRLIEEMDGAVARSEARRLAETFEESAEVIVDFEGMEWVGQGFADELFRVWQNDHPDIRLDPVNMNESVRRFVEQARAGRR